MLYVIATPIGHPRDITLRAIDALNEAEIIIGEERREASKLLKSLGVPQKELELLNEHSRPDEIQILAKLCETRTVALISDCGTPGFCDPGAQLVAECRKRKVAIVPLPGASSLMTLLSVTGHDLRRFEFRGFLPAETEARRAALKELDRSAQPVVLMDTPYRMGRLLDELKVRWPARRAVIGCDFTQSTEEILEGSVTELAEKLQNRKAEFILVLLPAR